MEILDAITKVVGPCSIDRPISLHEPDFRNTQAWTYVKNCLDTGWVSTAGKWVSRFEDELCRITGARNAIVVSNGTVALRLALKLVGVNLGDEVLFDFESLRADLAGPLLVDVTAADSPIRAG